MHLIVSGMTVVFCLLDWGLGVEAYLGNRKCLEIYLGMKRELEDGKEEQVMIVS